MRLKREWRKDGIFCYSNMCCVMTLFFVFGEKNIDMILLMPVVLHYYTNLLWSLSPFSLFVEEAKKKKHSRGSHILKSVWRVAAIQRWCWRHFGHGWRCRVRRWYAYCWREVAGSVYWKKNGAVVLLWSWPLLPHVGVTLINDVPLNVHRYVPYCGLMDVIRKKVSLLRIRYRSLEPEQRTVARTYSVVPVSCRLSIQNRREPSY